jgi:peptidoglycan hydrolase CwlO-like protein
MAKKEVVDTEKMLDDVQNKKFGLSITNIVSLVTVLSGLIAGWYTFTGRIDSLEEVVTGFAEASDIEIVSTKLQTFEDDIVWLREQLDTVGEVDLSPLEKDIINLSRDIKELKGSIRNLNNKIEELHGDPLAKFKK